GDQALAIALTKRPEVARLVANPQVENALTEATATTRWAQQLMTLAAGEVAATAALPYGLEYTHADAVWAAGYTGQGIVIASQDTGVQWDHPALQAAYRGWVTQTVTTTLTATGGMTTTVNHVYNWFDAWGLDGRPITCAQDAQIPCDDHGHGTHTVGTMVGDATAQGASILGMAPGAQWIGCRNMRRGVGTPASYTACFEFFLAPYPQGGDPFTDGRPELAPHIINNS
ncbi:MAG TPA: S8 family serine peptidase, partial [Caldilineaceae bacterium]|nr:S8 family serine peptidase [Caldilineaceae bacterium]